MNQRASIVSAVKTRLQGILTTGGYVTNIGNNVTVWNTIKFADADAYTQVDIRDTRDDMGEQSFQGGGQLQTHNLTIEVSIVHVSSEDPGTEIRKMIADVYKAVGTDEKWGLPLVVLQTFPVSDEILVSQEERKVVGALVTIGIQYRTAQWDN